MERCGVGPCEGHGDLRADRDGVKLKEGGKGRAPRVSEDSAAGCVLEGQTQVSVPREGGQEAGGPRGDRGSSVPLSRYGCSPSKAGEELGAQHGGPAPPPSPFSCLLHLVSTQLSFYFQPQSAAWYERVVGGRGWDLALGKPGQAFRGATALSRGQWR